MRKIHFDRQNIVVILRPKAEESKINILRSAQDDGNLHIALFLKNISKFRIGTLCFYQRRLQRIFLRRREFFRFF